MKKRYAGGLGPPFPSRAGANRCPNPQETGQLSAGEPWLENFVPDAEPNTHVTPTPPPKTRPSLAPVPRAVLGRGGGALRQKQRQIKSV